MQRNEKNSTTPNELLTFAFQEKQVRVVIIENQHIWLVASDVAEALEYQDASAKLALLEPKNIRENQQIFNAVGKPITVTLIDIMGCGFLVGGVKSAVGTAFHAWVFEVFAKGNIQDLRAKAIPNKKTDEKQEVGFQTFVFEGSANIRVFLDENGDPWFVASDVCRCLNLNTSEALHGRKDRNYEDGIDKRCIDNVDIPHSQSSNKTMKALVVSESGFYQLVFKSRKKEAMVFKKWVTAEVLPTIRKTGKYELPTVGEKKLQDSPTELNPALLELIMQKLEEMSVMRRDIDDLKASLQNFLSPTPAKASYVYLAYNHNTGLYKPGKGDNPDERAFVLELGGVEIEIVSKIWFPSSAIALAWEKAFHKMFENEARGREWFALNERHVQFFKNVAELVSVLYA
jgi:prophage antirepressor-like protein